ncbi:hypothetical protein ACHFCA_25465 [Delftia tsuruhatensis]
MLQLLGTFCVHQNQRCRAIVFHAAIKKVKRLDDPARRIVALFAQWLAVHHRARVVLRVMVRGHRNGAQGFLAHAVLMHVPHDPHGKTLGR